MKEVFTVIGKRPIKNFSKTRLAKDVGEEAALKLYEAFIKDFFLNFKKHCPDKKLYFFGTPTEKETQDYFCSFFDELGIDYEFCFQPDAEFFKRLKSCFEHIEEREGEVGVHLTGTDIPDFPFHEIKPINGNDFWIGADRDGGYYAVSTNVKNAKALVIDPANSKKNVYELTIQKAAELSLKINNLAKWSDIDVLQDLRKVLGRSSEEVIPNTHLVCTQFGVKLSLDKQC